MPGEPTLLRTLITARHWQRYETFAVQFQRAAGKLADEEGEEELAKMSVSARQFERWYAGKLRTLPHPDACRILEHMFGYPVQQLLAPADRSSQDTPLILGQDDPRPAAVRHDLQDPNTAMTHARTALLCANNAEHTSLAAWVRGLQSLITYWALRPRESLEYAQLGQQLPGTTGSVTVWLASLEARAWARLGNGTASRQAIARASELREQLTRNDLDEIGGMCYFSNPRQLYYASDAGAALPEHDESGLREETETFAADAVAAYEQASTDEKSFGDEAGSRTDLAIARIRTGNLDGAREAVQPVLHLPVALRIHGVVTSVLDVHRAVTTQAADTPLARDIQEEIEAYCRTPAAALPR